MVFLEARAVEKEAAVAEGLEVAAEYKAGFSCIFSFRRHPVAIPNQAYLGLV